MNAIVKILDILWVTIGALGLLYFLIREIPEETKERSKQNNQILSIFNLSFLLFILSVLVRGINPTILEWVFAGSFGIYVFFFQIYDSSRLTWIKFLLHFIAFASAIASLVLRVWPVIVKGRPLMTAFAVVDSIWFFSAIVFVLFFLFENKLSVKSWILLASLVTGIIAYILTILLIGFSFPKENVFAFIMWFVTLALVFVLCKWGFNLPDKNKKGKSIGWMTYVSFGLPFVAFLSQIITRWFHF